MLNKTIDESLFVPDTMELMADTARHLIENPVDPVTIIAYRASPTEQIRYVMSQEPIFKERFRINGTKLEYTGNDILNDSLCLANVAEAYKPGLVKDEVAFSRNNVEGFGAAYDAELARIAKLKELADEHKTLKEESKAYRKFAKRLANDSAGIGSNPLLLPAYIIAEIAAQKKEDKLEKTGKEIEKNSDIEKKDSPWYKTKKGALSLFAVGIMTVAGAGLAAYVSTHMDNEDHHDNHPHEYWALSGEDIAGGPDIPHNADAFGNVSFFENPVVTPVDVTNYSLVVSQYQWYNNATGRFYDIPAWDGNISKLPDSVALTENATADVKAAAYLLGEQHFKRSVIYHIEYAKNLSVQKLGGLSVGGLGAIDVKARIGLINEGPLIEKTFAGGEYKVHNISFQPEFTVAVDPMSIPSSVCNIPILNSTARILADSDYLIDRSNRTIGEYTGDLSGWDGKDISGFLGLPKANEFVNQTEALAIGTSIDNTRPWYDPARPWQPPAYGDVMIEKVNDTKALAKALIDMFPAKRGIQNISEDSDVIADPSTGGVTFAQNPSGNLSYLSVADYAKFLADGWRMNKTSEYLGTVEPATFNETIWKELNASASKEAWDRIAEKAKANASSVDAAFARIIATKRNATAWDYAAELFQKRKDVFINSTDPGNYDLKPGQRIINESEFLNNRSSGYVFSKINVDLDQLDLGNPNNVTGWPDLNASADAKALKWLKREMNRTSDAVNGYYRLITERNATDTNKIDSRAEIWMQKPWFRGLLTAVPSLETGKGYVAWFNVTDSDAVSNDKVDLNQSNDFGIFFDDNQTIMFNGSLKTAYEVYLALTSSPFTDLTQYYEFKGTPIDNFTVNGAIPGAFVLKKLDPYYDVYDTNKWPKRMYHLDEVIRVKKN